MFALRHFLLVSVVGLCCVMQFALHSCTAEDPLASVSPAAMAQTPDLGPELEIQAKGNDKDKDRHPHKYKKKGGLALASALCVAAMQAGMAANMTAETLAQYCVDLALELMRADYTLEP